MEIFWQVIRHNHGNFEMPRGLRLRAEECDQMKVCSLDAHQSNHVGS